MPGLVISRLTKTFPGPNGRPIRAVDDLSLEVASGETLAVLGPSGSGKTTLLRLLAGLDRPDSGTVSFSGTSLDAVPPGDRDLALVFQQPALYPHLTAFENVAFGLRLRRVPRAEAEGRVHETAQALGISDCLPARPDTLAGGQRQRVALARALVRRPKILLLDEPLSQLDGPLRTQLKRDLKRCAAAFAATTIWVTHDQREALAVGDRVAVLDEGRLEQTDVPARLYSHPGTVFVARFLGEPPMNLVPGRCRRQDGAWVFFPRDVEAGWELPAGLVPQGDEGEVLLGFRPEDVVQQPGSQALRLALRLEGLEYAGPAMLARLTLGAVELMAVLPPGFAAAAGTKLDLYVPGESLRWFPG